MAGALVVIAGAPLVPAHATALADVVVTRVTWTPAPSTVGNAVLFSASVRNQGTAQVPAGVVVGVTFWVDGTEVSWSQSDTAGLAVGATVTLAATSGPSGSRYWVARSGAHTLAAWVNRPVRFSESDTANNGWTTPLPVYPRPVGSSGSWYLKFHDEFTGSRLDTSRWATRSSAEADCGQGNPRNQQLEWNQAANVTESNGELDLLARRQPAVSPCTGRTYSWTSGLITTSPSYAFRYGYVEERAILPGPAGLWPAFWTWQVPGASSWVETDAYEYFSNNRSSLYLTQHSGSGGGCTARPWFDPTTAWHVYGADIEPTGTDWYVDGVHVCHTAATSTGPTNIIANLAVYSAVPPAASTTSAVERVDYVRAWQH